jgi:hypothetical protein
MFSVVIRKAVSVSAHEMGNAGNMFWEELFT